MTFSEILYLIIMLAFVTYAIVMILNLKSSIFKTLDLITMCNLNWVAYSVFMLIQPFLSLIEPQSIYRYVFWGLTILLLVCGKYGTYLIIVKRQRIKWKEAIALDAFYGMLIVFFNLLYYWDISIMSISSICFAGFVLAITYYLYNEKQRNVSYVYALMIIGSLLLLAANYFFKENWPGGMFVLIQMATLFLSLTGIFFYFYEYYSFAIMNQKNHLNQLEVDLSKAKEEIYELAYSHPVTKFPNQAMLVKDWTIHKHKKQLRTLGIIEIANWHQVEHRFETWSRDNTLKEIVKSMRIRESFEYVYHIRDNEFAVMTKNDVVEFREQLETYIHKCINEQVQTSLRCNMEVYSGVTDMLPNKEIGQILQEANVARQMAYKKQAAIMVYEPSFKTLIDKEMDFESKLRQAVQKGDWPVYYQPKIRVSDETICGAEALVRWPDEAEKEICSSPNYFIPLAEKLGLIHEISDVVINEVFKRSHQFLEMFGNEFEFSINISPLQLHDQQFVDRIEQKIQAFDIQPERFIFEITESTEILDYDDAIEKLEGLKRLGFKVSLDDFGVGYSNLHSIPELPIDEIKFDKLITDRLTSTYEYRLVMEYFLMLSQKLNLRTVIEGIETKEQVLLIQEMGVDECQGYYYSEPLDGDAFYKYLERAKKKVS